MPTATSERDLEGQRERSAIKRLRAKGNYEGADRLERGIVVRRLIERGLDPALGLSFVVWPGERLEDNFEARRKAV